MSDELSYIAEAVQRIEGKVDDLSSRVAHVEGGITVWKFVIPIGLTILFALLGYIAA